MTIRPPAIVIFAITLALGGATVVVSKMIWLFVGIALGWLA